MKDKDESQTDVLIDIATLPSFVDPMFNYADDLAWQYQRQLEEEQRQQEEKSE